MGEDAEGGRRQGGLRGRQEGTRGCWCCVRPQVDCHTTFTARVCVCVVSSLDTGCLPHPLGSSQPDGIVCSQCVESFLYCAVVVIGVESKSVSEIDKEGAAKADCE